MVTSAGCVVVKTFNGEPHILMTHSAGNWQNKLFGIPKGHVEKGEDLKEAALRETEEETGIKAEIVHYLGSVKKPGKTVHGFIALYKSGSLDGKKAIDYQRAEIDVAKFYPVDQAVEIAYTYQRDLLKKAKEYIETEM
jgi:NADH pyrophosphatase NudC (nudix superfamily)